MKNSFWGLIWSSFLEIQGVLLGLLGVIIGIILARFPFTTPISLGWVISISVFVLLLLLTLLKAMDTSFKENQKLKRLIFPNIIRVQKEQPSGLIICLLNFSEIFANDMSISFYYTDENGFELSIGEGFIRIIQSDGNIQAVLNKPNTVYQDVIDKLNNNDAKVLNKTRVKPGIIIRYNQP